MDKIIAVIITGTTPLLMHRFPLTEIKGLEKLSPQEQAEIHCYRMDDGELYLPGNNLWSSFVEAAKFTKGKGRASLQREVISFMRIREEHLRLGTKQFAIDTRAVVNPSTQGRIVRYRARVEKWRAKFSISYNPERLTDRQVRQVVEDAGEYVGVLDFRPACKGPFGRFTVTGWDHVAGKQHA